jgi:hypothetical protein
MAAVTYRSIGFVRLNDLHRVTVSNKDGLGIAEPSSVNGLTTDEREHGRGATIVTLERKNKG